METLQRDDCLSVVSAIVVFDSLAGGGFTICLETEIGASELSHMYDPTDFTSSDSLA